MSDTPPPPAAAPEPTLPAPVTSGIEPHIAAGLAAVFPLVGGVIFLVLEKKDKFVRFWAMQSVFFGGLAFAISIALRVVAFVFGFLPFIGKLMLFLLLIVYPIFGLAWFIVWVIGMVKAFSGKEWEIPWLGKLARQQLAKMDGETPPPAA